MDNTKVVHLTLTEPREGEKADYYFGSVTAIYSVFTRERLGIAQLTLAEYIRRHGMWKNQHFSVKIGEIIRNHRKNQK